MREHSTNSVQKDQNLYSNGPFPQANAKHLSLEAQMSHESSSTTPRFLFRVWREHDRDLRVVDTKDYVTPSLLKDLGRKRPEIHEVPTTELLQSAKAHLNAEYHGPSYFSTWTQSWNHLVPQLRKRFRSVSSWEDIHISIIDTKLLEKRNVVVLHSSFFGRLDHTIPTVEEEYLAYGIISGHGYKIVFFI